MEADVAPGAAASPAAHLAAGQNRWLDWAAPVASVGLHLVFVAVAWSVWGLDVAADPQRASWDYFWQTLPAEQLRGNLLEAMRYLHTQPPLFNLWGAFFLRAAGENVLPALAWANVALGVLVVAMNYTAGRGLGLGRVTAALASMLLAMLPSLVLYELYPLYELLSLFLLTGAVWAFARRRLGGRDGWLIAGFGASALLALTRSSFHLVLLIPVAVLAGLASDRPRRLVVWVLILTLPVLLWSGKNLAQFGFFGASSWSGMNLWRVAAADYDSDELRALADAGVISKMASEVAAFNRPAAYEAYGYATADAVPALAVDDFGNRVMIEVARQYGRDARSLIAHDPTRWLKTIGKGWTRFNRPTSSYDHLEANFLRLPSWVVAVEEAIHVRPFLARVGSVTYFLLPVSLFVFVLWASRLMRKGDGLMSLVRAEPASVLAAGLLLYVALVTSLFEYGENERFRFVVEPLFWLFAAGTATNLIRMRRDLQAPR